MSETPEPPSDNPYQPSSGEAPPRTFAEEPQEGFRFLAALAGFATDIGATFAGGCIIGIVAGIILVAQGTGPEQLEERLGDAVLVYLIGLVYGLGCTMLGGYVAAWVAGFAPVKHALGAGVLSLLFGVITNSVLAGAQPLWLTVLGLVLVLPAAVAGGLLRGKVQGSVS